MIEVSLVENQYRWKQDMVLSLPLVKQGLLRMEKQQQGNVTQLASLEELYKLWLRFMVKKSNWVPEAKIAQILSILVLEEVYRLLVCTTAETKL